MRRPLASLAASLLLGACTYDFQNPAEALDAGEITGRVVADLSGTGELSAVPGVTVTLRNSTNVQSTRPNGSFFMLEARPGRHTLLLSKDDGEGTTWALQRDVELGFGSDGQLEGVILGDLRLRYSVALGGTFTPPAGVTIDPFPLTPPSAFAIDEVTAVQATVVPETDGGGGYTGRFSYAIPVAPVGPHRLRFVISADVFGFRNTWVGGPLAQDVPVASEGQSLTLAGATLRTPNTFDTGKLRFRVTTPPGAPAATIRVNTVPATVEVAPTADSTGWVELDLTEGLYSIVLDLGATPGTYEAPPPVSAIVVANQTTELGTLYVVDSSAVYEAYFACLTDADCDLVSTCQDGTCRLGQPY